MALVLALTINESPPVLKEPAESADTPGRLRAALSDRPFLVLLGVACGFSPIVAGALLEARLPALIWTIQLAAAASAAVGLGVLASLRRRCSVTGP